MEGSETAGVHVSIPRYDKQIGDWFICVVHHGPLREVERGPHQQIYECTLPGVLRENVADPALV